MIILGVGIIFCTIQYFFSLKAKKIAIKLIPVYIIIFFALYAVAIYQGVVGTGSGFGRRIVTNILIIGVGAALVGDVIAWIAYWLR